MAIRSFVRRLTLPFRYLMEALPPFPRLPSREDFIQFWQNSFVAPRFPSFRDTVAWWREALVAPKFPSWREIAAWWREAFVAPKFPSPHDIAEWWRQLRDETVLPPIPLPPNPGEMVHRFQKRRTEGYPTPALPHVPSPKNMAEWFRENPARRRIVVLWAAAFLAMAGLLAAAPSISHTIKGWQARRLAALSFPLTDQQNWAGASIKLQDAFRLRPTEPEIWRAYAHLLSRTGQGTLAIEWWQKVVRSQPLSISDKRDYAGAALAARELTIAAEQIAPLISAADGPTPIDLQLAGQLATLRGYTGRAIDDAEQIMADRRSGPREILMANLLIVANTPRESQPSKDAYGRIIRIARDESNPAAPQALAFLAQQRAPGRLTTPSATALDAILPDTSSNALSLKEIADRLDHNSSSRPFHLMLALELRSRADPAQEKAFVGKAVEAYGNGDDETLIALGSWLYSHGEFEALLRVLPLERAVQRRELLMEHIDALASLHRLSDARDILLTEHPVLDPASQHMYLAVVRRKLGDNTAADNEWIRALGSAETPRSLIGLADFAEKMRVFHIADAAYGRLIKKQPELKSSYLSRLQLAQSLGQTARAREFALEIMRLWPEDDATHMREIYLRLLLDPSKETARAAEEEALVFVTRNPWDGGARSAVALARLRQGKAAAALSTLTEFMPGAPSSAVSASVYAAAAGANGWKEIAQEEARKLATENILPEERALIAPLLN